MDPAGVLLRWNALSQLSRIGIAGSVVAAVAIIVAAQIVLHPPRTPLFAAPLRSEQLAEAEERLSTWSVPFTPTADNLLVDTKRRNSLLLRLSLAGVPHSHVETSDDALQKVNALTPQAVIDAQTRDGLAGDIEMGLRGIEGIQDARVIVAPAKPGYFADETGADASASVRLALFPGITLPQSAIAGIRSFVAASVPGLDPRRITIVDDRGVALGEAEPAADATELQHSVQSALDAMLGAGVTIVRVHIAADSAKTARVSAAVLVDSNKGVDLYQVRSIAGAALGIDPRRLDLLDVEAVAFKHPPTARKDGWWLAYGAVVPVLPVLVTTVGIILVLRWSAAPVSLVARALAERIGTPRMIAESSSLAPSAVRGALEDEPPHAAAAIISALPAATAAAVLDLYPQAERAAILERMQRPRSPLISDAQSFLG